MAGTIRYMGTKKSLAPLIARAITRLHPQSTVVDAFAGTCAIACEVAPKHRVVANDLHAYAATIARALLVGPKIPTVAAAVIELSPHFRQNLAALSGVIADRLEEERRCLQAPDLKRFVRFNSEELTEPFPRAIDGLLSWGEYTNAPGVFPFALFTLGYPSTYFGIRQAAEIDSLRYAIEAAPERNRDAYMLALINAVSRVAAAPGHFAQYLVPRDQTSAKLIARIRRRSVLQLFYEALGSIVRPECRDRKNNLATRMDAIEFTLDVLPELVRGGGDVVVYADPPYSKAQYSRYYHVLETLERYDYPPLDRFKGRTRSDRVNTEFSKAGEVEAAMEAFVAGVAQSGSPLFLSYPRNGLLYNKGVDVIALLREFYPIARIAGTAELAHSTMGGAPGVAATDVLEDVYYARFKN